MHDTARFRKKVAEVWSTHNNLACMTQQVRWRISLVWRPSIPTYLTDGEDSSLWTIVDCPSKSKGGRHQTTWSPAVHQCGQTSRSIDEISTLVMNCVACRPVNSCLCGKHGWSGSTVDMMDYKFARLVIVRSHSILANQIAVGTICIKALSPMGSLVEWRTKLWTAECRPTYIEHRLFQRRLARGERMPR
jgi:hypothetical protein